ncbi:MFS transporter [uncultured Roseibium sp.]|uniref:MFS transporter n=1 Tax=uncultured Roseibium sp. TaxID=1936171 RepID=UPI0032178BF3
MTANTRRPDTGNPSSDPESLFKNRNFLLFLLSRTGSVTGTQILAVAIGWHVYQKTGEVLYLGLIGLFMFLPVLCLFLVAGFAADRFDRRLIVGICNCVNFVAMTAIGFYLMTGSDDIWPIFALLALNGSAQAFIFPALQAALPNIVPREVFAKAVATNSSVMTIGQLGGPAIGGFLIALIDAKVYFVAAVLFLIAAAAMFLVRADLRIAGKEPFGLTMLLGGFRHIWQTKVVLGAISIDLAAVLFGGVMGLLPVFAVDILKVGPEALGVMRAMPAIGALVVGVTLARWGLIWRIGPSFFISLAIFGLSILVLSLSTNYWLSVSALAVYGASDMVSVYVRQTLVQIETPNDLRGRVSAVNSVSINASNQMGDFRAGTMSALMGTPAAVALGACVTLGVTLLWYKLFPQLRELTKF